MSNDRTRTDTGKRQVREVRRTQYDEVVDYLVRTIGCTLSGLGKGHEKVKPYEEAKLIDFFEKYIYKDMNNYFLVGDSDAIYIYNGEYYETHKNNEDMLLNVIKDAMKKMGVGLVYQKNSYKKIAIQCVSGMKITTKARFVPNRNFIVFKNGVLNLETMELLPFNMDYRTDIILDFEYKPYHTSPLWDKIISQTIPDEGMRKAFQMFCGAFLANRNDFSIEYICYMLGSGRNGKSVVTGAIANAFGENLVSSFSLQELLFDNDKQYNRAALVGKIANFSDDVTKKDYSGGAYKQMVSGHKMTARNPFGRPFDLTEIPYLVCCVNEMPPTTDDTTGHYRRMLPILCPNQVSEKDADEELPSKLGAPDVKSAIINWVIEGRKMVFAAKGKIEISQSIRDEVENLQNAGNSARRWISERGLIKVEPLYNDTRWKPMSEWMEDYLTFCKKMSEPAKNAASVGKIFKEKGFATKRRKDGVWWCIGTKYVDTDENKRDEDLPF